MSEAAGDRRSSDATHGATQPSDLERRLRTLMAEGSGSQRRLAEFVLRNPITVAASSIDDLAKAVGVSAPTVSRFARELEFDGFSEMRAAVAHATQALMDPVTKLRDQLHATPSGHRASDAFDAVRKRLALVDADELEHAVLRTASRIRNAGTVYIMGFGLSSYVAAMFAVNLRIFHKSVVAVVESGGTEVAVARLASIEKGDLLITITVPRYTFETIGLSRFAKERGVDVVVLTDSAASPIAELADELVLIPCSHPVLPSSMGGMVLLAETITTAVMISDPESAEKARRLAEMLSLQLRRDTRFHSTV